MTCIENVMLTDVILHHTYNSIFQQTSPTFMNISINSNENDFER